MSSPVCKAFVFSRAKEPRCRYLSNFTHVPGRGFPVTMPDGTIQWFRSIELAFHAHKFYYLHGGVRPDMAADLSCDGAKGGLTDSKQKSVGGKAAMKLLHVALDVPAWNAVAPSIMEKLVFCRAAHDAAYTKHCKDLVAEGRTIVHCVRGGETKDHLALGPLLQKLGNLML